MVNAITVTIGRNLKGTTTPLSTSMWDSFRTDVKNSLIEYAETRYLGIANLSTFDGHNSYNGVEEDSHTVHLVTENGFIADYALHPSNFLIRTFQDHADFYGQDSIALLLGQSMLVSPSTPTLATIV